MMKDYIKLIILFGIITFLVIFIPVLNGKYVKSSKLYISEILASNQNVIYDDDNEYSDYIEIYNGYNYPINLQGYHLSDSEYATSKWEIPDVTINSKSYLVIFASGKDKYNGDVIHTNFKLSSSGEVITLSDKSGNIINKFSYPECSPNTSYGYYNGDYVFMKPSPGIKNSNKIINTKTSDIKDKIIINEYMTHNKSYNYDSQGFYYDWVELYNKSTEDISLNNIYLSDNITNLTKFMLPNVIIKANDYLLIYLAGEKKVTDNGIYANFKLSDDDEIVLSDGKKVIDKIKVVSLKDNISYGLKDGIWYYFTSPTPGRINNTASFLKIGEDNGRT